MSAAPDQGPRLLVEAAACRVGSTPDRWLAAWRIGNLTAEPLTILAAWLPHGRFRGERQTLDPPLDLGPGQETPLELGVACREPAGTVVENAFLILSLRWRERPWRVLARHRVSFERGAAPRPICEVVSAQPIGFSAPLPRYNEGV